MKDINNYILEKLHIDTEVSIENENYKKILHDAERTCIKDKSDIAIVQFSWDPTKYGYFYNHGKYKVGDTTDDRGTKVIKILKYKGN